MPVDKRLRYLRDYRWSSLPGYVVKIKRLDFIEYETGAGDILQSKGTERQILMTVLYKYAGLNNREPGEDTVA
jgi:hypothetical protein